MKDFSHPYWSARECRQVIFGKECNTQIRVWVASPLHLEIGVGTYEKGEMLCALHGRTYGVLDTFRAVRILLQLKALSHDVFLDVLHATWRPVHQISTQKNESAIESLSILIDATKVSEILSSYPPDLIRQMQKLRAASGPLGIEFLHDELRAGKLKWDKELEQFGIESPQKSSEEEVVVTA